MSTETGISLYFWDQRIRIWNKALSGIGNPAYIHLLINEKKKYLFIQRCEERDNDAFPIDYREDTDARKRYCIFAKDLMEYLARLIGVPYPSNSLRFLGKIMPDGSTLFVDLNEYKEIPYEMKNAET